MATAEERVKKVTAEVLNLEPNDVKSEHEFTTDLGADSVQSVELVAMYEEDVPMNVSLIIHKQLVLISSLRWEKHLVTKEIKEALQLLADGKIKTKPLISHEFSLDKIMEAFEVQCNTEQSIKVLIKP